MSFCVLRVCFYYRCVYFIFLPYCCCFAVFTQPPFHFAFIRRNERKKKKKQFLQRHTIYLCFFNRCISFVFLSLSFCVFVIFFNAFFFHFATMCACVVCFCHRKSTQICHRSRDNDRKSIECLSCLCSYLRSEMSIERIPNQFHLLIRSTVAQCDTFLLALLFSSLAICHRVFETVSK